MTYDPILKEITFAPTLSAEVGSHTVSIKVTDGIDSPTYTFIVTVVNTAPYFTANPPIDNFSITYISTVKTIDLSALIKDDENHSIILTSFFTL